MILDWFCNIFVLKSWGGGKEQYASFCPKLNFFYVLFLAPFSRRGIKGDVATKIVYLAHLPEKVKTQESAWDRLC